MHFDWDYVLGICIVLSIAFCICFAIRGYNVRCDTFVQGGYEQSLVRGASGYWIKIKGD